MIVVAEERKAVYKGAAGSLYLCVHEIGVGGKREGGKERLNNLV